MLQIFTCFTTKFLGCSSRGISSMLGHRTVSQSHELFQKQTPMKFITFPLMRNVHSLSLHHPPTLSVLRLSKRFYAKKPSKLSFEVNSNVGKDVTVFTYSNARFFRMLTVFGIVQFFFWANMAMFSYSGLRGLETKSDQQQNSWWNMIFNFQSQHKYRIAVGCVALGYIVLFFTWIYPLRTISKLVLEKGGQMVRITTYTHFGRTKEFAVPLNDVSCTQSRLARGVQVSLKIRGKWFYYLMDKREGVFTDPHVFDYVVGLNRSLK